jgi:hypothetical protein
MRRAVVFAAAVAVLVAAPTAAAGSFAGVTVAKDSKRKSVVVVSGRSVRTVRAGAGYAGFRVGQRIVVTALRLADGTYRASNLRAAGRSRRVRFGAVVVKHDAALRRLILSAGGSVFAVRSAPAVGRRRASTAKVSAPARGSRSARSSPRLRPGRRTPPRPAARSSSSSRASSSSSRTMDSTLRLSRAASSTSTSPKARCCPTSSPAIRSGWSS